MIEWMAARTIARTWWPALVGAVVIPARPLRRRRSPD